MKTTDGGLRDMNKTYTNYDDTTQVQKSDGSHPTQAEIDAASNSIGFVNAVNNRGLCGYADWSIPSKEELSGIVSIGLSHSGPYIHWGFFPNTPISDFWSNSPYDGYSHYAWSVGFGNSIPSTFGYQPYRGKNYYARLVRGRASFDTFALTVGATGAGSGRIETGGIDCARADRVTSGTCTAKRGKGSSVTLTATPVPGSFFTTWSGACSGTSPSCVVRMDAAKSVSANFDLGPLVNGACGLSNGQALSAAPSIHLCTTGTASGISVNLPRTWGWSCSGYNGGSSAMCSATSSLDLFTLTVKKSGSGSVTSSPTGIVCDSDCSEAYTTGSSVTLAASSYAVWGGACAGNFGLSCSLTMNASKSVSVNTAIEAPFATQPPTPRLPTMAPICQPVRCSAAAPATGRVRATTQRV